MRKLLAVLLVLFVVAFFFRNKTYIVGNNLVEYNRFTGKAEYLQIAVPQEREVNDEGEVELSAKDLQSLKMDVDSIQRDGRAYINGSIYNPTVHRIQKVIFRIREVDRTTGKPGEPRDYGSETAVPSLSERPFSFNILSQNPVSVEIAKAYR